MRPLRIWHYLFMMFALALLFALARNDLMCTPPAGCLAVIYFCAILGWIGASRKGRSPYVGLIMGFVLGPFGVLVAWSNFAPGNWSASSRSRRD
jgi:hypothetical protein